MSLNKPPEKAFFRAARALYGLQRWKESMEYLKKLLSINPNNTAARQDVASCKCRLREEVGEYDFKSMLEEAVAKVPSPDMDRATYVGPIEVRDCEIKLHGRGLFTTRAVAAGELLLCEKAFAVVFADANKSVEASKEKETGATEEGILRLSTARRAELVSNTLVKLHRNPSLQPTFADLYPGPDCADEQDEGTRLPLIDEYVIR